MTMTMEKAIQMLRLYEVNEYGEGELKTWYNGIDKDMREALDMAIEALKADAEQGYTEWLEKIIVDNEGANEWLCEDTPDLEWCAMNCHYSSIQAECLRHLYAISKGGEDE